MKIEKKEKRILIIGGIIAALLLSYEFLLSPFLERINRHEAMIGKKEKELSEIKTMKEEYLLLREKMKEVDAKARAKSGSALSELENIALRSNIRKNISSMKPQISSAAPEGHRETTIEIRIENITLYELVNYLNMAEGSAHPMRIKKLNIKTRYDNPKKLDSTVVISSMEYS
ncbi:MAG: type II secretion system protein GspM [Nitrospirota bacterium]